MAMLPHSVKTQTDFSLRADMVSTRPGTFSVFLRSVARVMVAVLAAVSVQVAFAQAAADCNEVTAAAQAAANAQSAALDQREQLAHQAIENAKSCIDRLMQLIRNMSPTVPSLQSISIQAIVDYLSNRACSVATTYVQQTVGAITQPINGVIGGVVGGVNGAGGGVIGQPILNPGGGAAPAQPQPQPQPPPQNIFQRLGCAFGAGTNCL